MDSDVEIYPSLRKIGNLYTHLYESLAKKIPIWAEQGIHKHIVSAPPPFPGTYRLETKKKPSKWLIFEHCSLEIWPMT